jgi:hypothetical protein
MFLILALVLVSGCDVDPFNAACRHVVDSGFDLCQFEGEALHYLEEEGSPVGGDGVFEGTVETIGWNQRAIIARRHSTFRGDPDGLIVLDIRTKKLTGPFDPEKIARKYPSVVQRDVVSVWGSLRWGLSSLP